MKMSSHRLDLWLRPHLERGYMLCSGTIKNPYCFANEDSITRVAIRILMVTESPLKFTYNLKMKDKMKEQK